MGVQFVPEKDIPDLSGKVVLVTGGNAGLGKETVLQLAKHHPREIFLAARTPSKASDAIAEIKKTVPDANITFLQLDLTSLASVKAAADAFTARSDRLDILVNNAGIMAVPYSTTQDGYEIQFGTNHMGHALLTKLLLPTLLRTAELPNSDVRIVNLSSTGHQMAFMSGGVLLDQSKAQSYNTWARYGSAKLANILHARGLQQHYPQLTCISCHPGVINTDLFLATRDSVKNIAPMRWVLDFFSSRFMQTVQTGARNTLWCCAAPKQSVRGGYYYMPVGKRDAGFWYAKSLKQAERLWEYTEGEFERLGYSNGC